jgi:hypothetical protein
MLETVINSILGQILSSGIKRNFLNFIKNVVKNTLLNCQRLSNFSSKSGKRGQMLLSHLLNVVLVIPATATRKKNEWQTG